jgi:preprotein translocase subunit SecG
MNLFITVLHVLVCLVLIVVVLLQRGKGAEIGAVFGGGGTTLFGSRGAGNFLTKLTTWSAALFMATSLYLAYSGRLGAQSGLDLEDEDAAAASDFKPVAPPAEKPAGGDFAPVPAPAEPAPPSASESAPASAANSPDSSTSPASGAEPKQ